MCLLTLVAAAASEPHFPPVWAEFGRSGARDHRSEHVEIATGGRRVTNAFPYRLRLTVKQANELVKIKWAHAGLCPAVQTIIHDMRNIPMPIPAPHGSPDAPRTVVTDGTSYHLTSPSNWPMSKINITSKVATPLARWIDDALKQLAPCWSDNADG